MANVKISDLTAASAVADANQLEINESGTSKRVTAAQLKTYATSDTVSASSGGTFSGDVSFGDGADIITASAGTSNFRAGVNAGNSIQSGGNYNVVVGDEAGTTITTGDRNTLIGYQAGDAITTGSKNTALGRHALTALIDADDNTAIGDGSLAADTKGTKSTAIGRDTLGTQNFTSATNTYNTAVGYSAGVSVTTGEKNTLIGGQAGDALTDTDANTAVGFNALGSDTLGTKSVAIGESALFSQNFTSATVSYNTAVGMDAGVSVTNGDKNTLIGMQAGDGITTGGNNTVVGALADTSSSTGNSEIVLGKSCIGQGSYNFTFGKDNGSDRVYNQFSSNATFTRVSDERYKKDIQTNTDCGLDFINDLRTVTFKFKAKSEIPDTLPDYDAEKTTATHTDKLYGVIAQEVKAALDSHNITDFGGHHEDPKTGIQGVAQSMFIYPLIKAVQELSAKNDALEARITTLEG